MRRSYLLPNCTEKKKKKKAKRVKYTYVNHIFSDSLNLSASKTPMDIVLNAFTFLIDA